MSALPGPDDITRVVLANGLTVLVRENRAAPVAVLQGSVPAGALHETPEQAGLASFVAGLLSRGSARYDFAAFNEYVEAVGGNLTFSADTHSTDFGITCLSEDFALLVDVLADALRHPTFPAEYVEKLRRQRLVYLQERDQDTGSVANLRFYETLFGRQHPYGRATSGYIETINALQRADVVAFHARRYTPNGAVIVVAGDVDTVAVIDLLERQLGDWQSIATDRTVPPLPIDRPAQRIFVAMTDKVQSDIVVGVPAVARHDPDYYAVRVANCVLGQFGLMGRLGAKVREEQGLAYYAYSSVSAEDIGGTWTAGAGVSPSNVDKTIESIRHEFALLGEEGVPDDELADSQAYLTGVVPLTLETNDGVANTLLNMEWHGLGLDYLYRYRDLICGVTAADVQRVASIYLQPERCTVVVAGPETSAAA